MPSTFGGEARAVREFVNSPKFGIGSGANLDVVLVVCAASAKAKSVLAYDDSACDDSVDWRLS
jgi:hypothetical protein